MLVLRLLYWRSRRRLQESWTAPACASKFAFRVGLGIDTSKLPPAMTAEDVVTASLSALARQEVVCIPSLADPALFGQVTEA